MEMSQYFFFLQAKSIFLFKKTPKLMVRSRPLSTAMPQLPAVPAGRTQAVDVLFALDIYM